MDKMLKKYYADRALEYDKIYLKPERQSDLRKLENIISTAYTGMNVLEIACGTGYWTKEIAKNAISILGIDCNKVVLDIAKYRKVQKGSVSFQIADAYKLDNINKHFNAGYCGFWYSHIPKLERNKFLNIFHSKLLPDSKVIMLDNRYVAGSSTPVSRIDSNGDSYQSRELEDGSLHEVLKNFPSKDELYKTYKNISQKLEIHFLEYYWLIMYNT
ncbi:MAG TPA: class I SAM-dependent methyltransferase [Victivallales bacterium]|nr:class I SAM-dependent methyltransferase [Victivallales bacterium]